MVALVARALIRKRNDLGLRTHRLAALDEAARALDALRDRKRRWGGNVAVLGKRA